MIKISVYVLVMLFPVACFAMGEAPSLNDIPGFAKKKEVPPTPVIEAVVDDTQSTENQVEVVENETFEMTEDTLDAKRKLKTMLKRKQFDKALEIINEIPDQQLTEDEKMMREKMIIFQEVEALEKENVGMFKPDNSLDPAVQLTVKRLYKGAQQAILEDKPDLAKDLLVQSLYLDRKNYKSKKLLEKGLGLPLGSYKVENVEEKYWSTSLVSIRSGLPGKAVDDLRVLEYFDPENSKVFERMGSAYYMMGEIKPAITAWKRALYLDPGNQDLETFIQNAEKEDTRQKALVKELMSKKETEKEDINLEEMETTMLGVYSDSNRAYASAEAARKQVKDGKVVVEETNDGRWKVVIVRPKKLEE